MNADELSAQEERPYHFTQITLSLTETNPLFDVSGLIFAKNKNNNKPVFLIKTE